MPLTPTELREMQEAEQLCDALCRAAGVTLSDARRAQAISALEIELRDLRLAWRRRASRTSGIRYEAQEEGPRVR